MGAAGPLNPKGRSIAKDPSGQVFWSAAAARSPRSGRGKNLPATVSGGPAPPIGLTPEQGMGPRQNEESDAEAVDQQATRRDKGRRPRENRRRYRCRIGQRLGDQAEFARSKHS